MPKVRPLIITDLKLKIRVIEFLIDQLAEDLNIDKEFQYKNFNLIKEYALVRFELQRYTFTIPYKELVPYQS